MFVQIFVTKNIIKKHCDVKPIYLVIFGYAQLKDILILPH